MTVAELIAKLQEMPQDMPVYRQGEFDNEEISAVATERESVWDYEWDHDFRGDYVRMKVPNSGREIDAVVLS